MSMICVKGSGECTGCMACQTDPEPIFCGICGEAVEVIYRDKNGYTLGCNNCVREVDPYNE